MYRTDKQFMKNPATAPQRIYIGALPKTVVAADLEDKFGQHGKILGLAMQTGFAFIQFETEHQAQAAIQAEHGSMMYGKKIIVKQALDKSKGPSNFNPRNMGMGNPNMGKVGGGGGPGPGPGGPMMSGKPSLLGDGPPKPAPPPPPSAQEECDDMQEEGPEPMHDMEENMDEQCNDPPSRYDAPPDRFDGPPGRRDGPPGRFEPSRHDGPSGRFDSSKEGDENWQDEEPMRFEDPPSRYSDPPSRFDDPPSRYDEPPSRFEDHPPRFNEPSRFDDPPIREGPRFERGRGRGRGRGGRMNSREDRFPPPHDKFREKKPFYPREESFIPPPAYNPPPADVPPARNDCEIIVVSKDLTEYAEYIEQGLRQIGLTVDLLFPNEDVPIGRVLANISSRGSLYAILVMPQNQEHRSLTLNILHGVPQEHRNMPVEDSLVLISRNFEAYMRGENVVPENAAGLNLTDRHPMPIQMILNLLAENRHISSIQYDKLIKYLQDRRELQAQFEIAEGIETTSEGSNSKQAELQNRILNILNKSTESATAPSQTPPANTAVSSGAGSGVTPSPLLKDPTVQKALDSLLLGDMFKSMGTA